MLCVVQWKDELFVKGMHSSSKNVNRHRACRNLESQSSARLTLGNLGKRNLQISLI